MRLDKPWSPMPVRDGTDDSDACNAENCNCHIYFLLSPLVTPMDESTSNFESYPSSSVLTCPVHGLYPLSIVLTLLVTPVTNGLYLCSYPES
ncbi:hypothetical protein J6590_048699 [Homalodisca vitripennis]|nr:hypothetical protein J6590_048699 [Homalodisca vitripennis]